MINGRLRLWHTRYIAEADKPIAENINFIAFKRSLDKDHSPLDGQVFGVFVIIVAAAGAAVALDIVLNLYQRMQ